MICICPNCNKVFNPNETKEGLTETERKSRAIIEITCRYYNISEAQLLSASRKQHVADARHVVMVLLLEICHYSKTKIARMMKRDHTSIIYAQRKIQDYIKIKDPQSRDYQRIMDEYLEMEKVEEGIELVTS
jgi:chromosomal replication initiation ATPase DnaA